MTQLGPALYLGMFGHRVMTVIVIWDKAFLLMHSLLLPYVRSQVLGPVIACYDRLVNTTPGAVFMSEA